jgi:lysyl-tRNA synthetase, class II
VVIAAAPLGADWVGADNAVLLGFTVGLLVTFILVRVNTRLIRANVSWWFHDIEKGGTHIHHMVFGVIIMVASGLLTFALTPAGLGLQLLAVAFGAGVALTLDEFALILHLEDVYWQEQGRLSVDAVIVAASAGLLSLLVGPPLVSSQIAGATGWLLAVLVAVDLACSVISILKGKLWTGFIGIWVPIVAQVGAIRLARPGSPWARRAYADRPKRLARAEAREHRGRRRGEALKSWFYDLIAGQPSLPPLGLGKDEPREEK